eukprot:CAMPEP_0201865614 /NCGR_PEP_ID=MMETSP0902-20130614/441_1 /ASSEMBLY_ACC=CAM_ASM_000551 /TAXON_ID=420261 /ORGANISM="Thalassiosira antarctica, Strain CCMP982" /LENGTH=874 /DNA_ID=CAMNT_0048390405 /DNA_START=134 /DNA_END=2756 /DNA_ORIENTATION=-
MSLLQPDRLLGRSAEESILLNAYFASLSVSKNSPASSILIHGDSGIGKTKLAETLRPHVLEDDGYFIQGKFDQLSYASAKQPYSIIASAFADYCSAVEHRDKDTRQELANKLRREIQREERTLLFEAIPALRRIIGGRCYPVDENYHPHHSCDACQDETKISHNLESNSRAHRLNYLIRKFVSVMSDVGDPIILLLDDMQWANKEELDLLHHIMLGGKNPFIFIFTCRPMDASHPFFQAAEDFYCKTDITLRRLRLDSVRDLVSETLGIEADDCATLAGFISNVTDGNPFFVQQQIISFREKGLLRFEEKWVWDDIDIMEEAGILDTDVMSVLSEKIKRLPPLTQQVLKICSYIGSKTDIHILGMLIRETHCAEEFDNDENETLAKNVISVAAHEGLVTLSQDEISFTHDSFAEAAYSLLEPEERGPFHLKLGKLLIQHVSKDLFQEHLFTIAVQLARGNPKSLQNEDRISTVRIFLNAGVKSYSASAFPVALSWFSFGISLLQEQDWLHHRRLCADIYLKAADASSITGDYDDMNSWLAIIFDRCNDSVVDLLTAYYIRVRKLAAKDEDPKALDVGLEALRLVNIRFPSKNMILHIMVRFAQTRCSMKIKGVDKLIELPPIIDEQMIIALKLLNLLIHYALNWNQELFPLLIFKAVNLNMTHGMSPQMPSAVALYGAIINRFGFPIDEAYRPGELALALQQTISSPNFAHVTVLNHASSFLFIKKLSDCLKTLRSGWDSGLKEGKIFILDMIMYVLFLCHNDMPIFNRGRSPSNDLAELHGWVSIFSGQPLRKISRSLAESSSSMKEHNAMSSLRANGFHQQAVGSLLGDSSTSHGNDGCFDICDEKDLILDGQFKLNELVVSVFLVNNELAW